MSDAADAVARSVERAGFALERGAGRWLEIRQGRLLLLALELADASDELELARVADAFLAGVRTADDLRAQLVRCQRELCRSELGRVRP